MMTATPEPGADRLDRIERIVLGLADDMADLKAAMTDMNTRMTGVETRLTGVETRLTGVEDRMTGVETRLTGVEDRMTGVETRLTGVEDHMTGVETRLTGVEDHMTGVETRLTGVEASVGSIRSIQDDLAVMKGWQTELAVERRAYQVFARLCDGELLRIYPQSELRHYTRLARQAGSISRMELAYAESIDFILEGTDARNAPVMYAVEVSHSAGPDDVDRAVGKAALLARLLGREVRPAVVGARFTAEFEIAAAQESVAYTYIRNGDSVKR